jgi:hypothetical protein
LKYLFDSIHIHLKQNEEKEEEDEAISFVEMIIDFDVKNKKLY